VFHHAFGVSAEKHIFKSQDSNYAMMKHTSRIRLFPQQTEIREGQAEFYNDAYETAEKGKILFAYAPTGSGKTIASLSGLLESALPNDRKVIFLTTRIAHHKQAINEIKNINHRSAKMLEQLGLLRITAVDKINKADMCYLTTKYGRLTDCDVHLACKFRAKGSEYAGLLLDTPLHANEAIRMSKERRYCAHFAASKAMAQADIVVCDYSYLFDREIRQFFLNNLGVGLSSCDVIIDEAHNLVDRIRDLNTLEITPGKLRGGIGGLSFIASIAKERDDSETMRCAEIAKKYIHKIEKELIRQSAVSKKDGARLTSAEADALLPTLEESLALDHILKFAKSVSPNESLKGPGEVSDDRLDDELGDEVILKFKSNIEYLELLRSSERILLKIAKERYPFYGSFMEKTEANGGREAKRYEAPEMHKAKGLEAYWTESEDYDANGPGAYGARGKQFSKSFKLKVVPFDAAWFSKEVFDSLHSAVLMSGTLPKKDMFQELLGIDRERVFEIGKEAYPSPFDPLKQPIFICSEATTRQKERGTEGNLNAMVDIIANSAEACYPNSFVIFYPSYGFMEDMIPRLHSLEKLFAFEKESRGEKGEEKDERQKRIEAMAKEGRPMAFHAVISGSSNEGIDWIGKRFNMIIVAGFPHPNYNEEQQAYDEYLDWKHKRKGFGYENATTIAMIKADQAIGRGIRKASDYCACILIDPRFIRHRDLLPVHLRKYAREVQASELGGKIRNFFENAEKQKGNDGEKAGSDVENTDDE